MLLEALFRDARALLEKHGVKFEAQTEWDIRMKLSPVEDIRMELCDYEKFIAEYCSPELYKRTRTTRRESVMGMMGAMSTKANGDVIGRQMDVAQDGMGNSITYAEHSRALLSLEESLISKFTDALHDAKNEILRAHGDERGRR